MKPSYFRRTVPVTLIATSLSVAFPAQAFDVSDRLSISGIVASTGQCQAVSALLPSESYGTPLDANGDPVEETLKGNPPGGYDDSMDAFGNECRGGLPFQLELSYHPDDSNEFFVRLGFAAGNGLNEVSPWVLTPWAADLEDDVKDINGRNRDYLLAAWYKHRQTFRNGGSLGTSFGLLDSTDYLDGNAYANDEYTQFMNEVFVNSGSYGLPSYDAGAALEWESGPWSINGIGMNIGENDEGSNFNFWGVQAAYRADTSLGVGNYRLILAGTSSAFLDPTETKTERRLAGGLSFDQELGDVVGGFLRLAWQQEEAMVDYRSIYSGGLDFIGKGWNCEGDNIGIGYAYLDGGNQGIDSSQVFEAYYRAALNEFVAVTADVQYMKDALEEVDPSQDNPQGWIFGLRLTAEF